MNLTEKLKITMLKQKINQTTLASLTEQSQKNLSAKMLRNDFKISEYEKLVNALGCELIVQIKLPNGEIV